MRIPPVLVNCARTQPPKVPRPPLAPRRTYGVNAFKRTGNPPSPSVGLPSHRCLYQLVITRPSSPSTCLIRTQGARGSVLGTRHGCTQYRIRPNLIDALPRSALFPLHVHSDAQPRAKARPGQPRAFVSSYHVSTRSHQLGRAFKTNDKQTSSLLDSIYETLGTKHLISFS